MKFLTLSLKTIVMVAAVFLFGAMLANATGHPELLIYFGLIALGLALVPRGKQESGMLYSITVTDIVTEWGAFYRQQGQTIQDIMKKLMQKSVTESFFPRRVTDQTIMEKASVATQRVLQRFQKAFTPIGGMTFEPLKIPLYKLKIDVAEYPDDISETWLGFLDDNNLDRKQWPIVAWYISLLLDQQQKDLELNEIWSGVPGSITPGTATSAGTSLMGLKKTINTLNGAGNLNLITMGAVPTDAEDFVDYVEDMWGQTDRLLRNEIDFIFMEEDKKDLFRDGMRAKYNVNYKDVDDDNITKLRNANVLIQGLPSMVGSDKIWFTPQWNRQMGIRKSGNENTFQVENVDRQVKIYTDYHKGFGFWIGQYVTSNDVELT